MFPDFYTDTGKFYILSRGPSIFLWKKPLPFKFLASALIVVQSCLPDRLNRVLGNKIRNPLKSNTFSITLGFSLIYSLGERGMVKKKYECI